MKGEVEDWLKKAKNDLNAAKYNFDGKQYEVAAFLSQQAAEKALKAFYVKKFKKLWKIHDLKILAVELKAPEHIVELAITLNPAYITSRYPGMNVDYKASEVKELIVNAQKVIEWVEKSLLQ